VIKTQHLITCPFHDATDAMALAEGENTDLTGWQTDHIAYFTRFGGLAPDMIAVWEHVTLIEVC
jgi:uncharacterized protein YhfF